jgi:hypothetical protein
MVKNKKNKNKGKDSANGSAKKKDKDKKKDDNKSQDKDRIKKHEIYLDKISVINALKSQSYVLPNVVYSYYLRWDYGYIQNNNNIIYKYQNRNITYVFNRTGDVIAITVVGGEGENIRSSQFDTSIKLSNLNVSNVISATSDNTLKFYNNGYAQKTHNKSVCNIHVKTGLPEWINSLMMYCKSLNNITLKYSSSGNSQTYSYYNDDKLMIEYETTSDNKNTEKYVIPGTETAFRYKVSTSILPIDHFVKEIPDGYFTMVNNKAIFSSPEYIVDFTDYFKINSIQQETFLSKIDNMISSFNLAEWPIQNGTSDYGNIKESDLKAYIDGLDDRKYVVSKLNDYLVIFSYNQHTSVMAVEFKNKDKFCGLSIRNAMIVIEKLLSYEPGIVRIVIHSTHVNYFYNSSDRVMMWQFTANSGSLDDKIEIYNEYHPVNDSRITTSYINKQVVAYAQYENISDIGKSAIQMMLETRLPKIQRGSLAIPHRSININAPDNEYYIINYNDGIITGIRKIKMTRDSMEELSLE